MTDVDQGQLYQTVRNIAVADSPVLDIPGPTASVLEAAGTARIEVETRVERLEDLASQAIELGMRRVQMLAWRDFEDPEAGGSELHAERIASLWARAGLDVSLRTSAVKGLAVEADRGGVHVLRKSGRYGVFPRTAFSGLVGRRGRPDGLVEIWNGMPFFSPLWARCPRIVFLHHVHADMWRMVLTPRLARLGELIELRMAPPVYRRSRIVTLSDSSREEIVSMLGLAPGQVTVAPPGVDERFSIGGKRSTEPLVVAVGRLVPVKRLEMLVDALVRIKQVVPGLRAVIAGEGYERPKVEAKVADAGATGWIELPGYLLDDDLVELYRSAWVLVSNSLREGWNMTITEAAACGTPAVVTDIAGHRDSVVHGVTGFLSEPGEDFVSAVTRVLADSNLREGMAFAALRRSRDHRWDAAATCALAALVDEANGKAPGRGTWHPLVDSMPEPGRH